MSLSGIEERGCLDYTLIRRGLADNLHSCARSSSTRGRDTPPGNVDERQYVTPSLIGRTDLRRDD